MANCKLYSITVGTGYRGGGMVIAARSKEEAIGLIHVYEDDIAKKYMEVDTLKDIGVEVNIEPKVLFCDYYIE
ncbi:hypothetical protein [Paraprevotella clara]|jgi:hypothetical protein|uniref:hypothetical protein n=1 Tax=Paraprevotella clara TaxID=454154 RepID=UPI00266EBBDC|nr:hypothetical protein [Paraprevotella clara]